jgi:hypothetical protein
MPRTSPAASSVTVSVRELLGAVTNLLTSVSTAVASSGPVFDAAGRVGRSVRTTAKAAGAKGANLKKALKAHWAKLTPAQHKARIGKMLAGRGLKPKVKRPPTAKGLKLKKAIAASWARMTPAERSARVKKMLAGRGLKPKAKPAA